MTSIKYYILSALCIASGLHVSAQTTIEQCVRMAYDNYPQISEYGLIEASRKYDLNNAALAWVPQLSLSGKASWQSSVVEMPFDIEGFKFNIPHDQYGITADLNQQIWDGGASAVKRDLVNATAEVKNRQLEVNLYSIRSRVQNIYLSIMLIDEQLSLSDVLRSKLERNLSEVQAMVENGVANETDIDQIRVSLLSCEQQKSALILDRKAYVKMLSLLTGADLENETLLPPTATAAPASGICRPEMALYDAQEQQNRLQKKQLSTAISPKLNLALQAGYGRPGLNMLSGKFDPYLLAAVKLQWNFGSLYTLHNDRRKADAEAARIELARNSFILNTSMEATQKQSEIDKAADVLSKDEEIIALREKISGTAERQYKEGVVKMNDYLSLLDEEFNARLNYNLHLVQYTMAVYELQNTLGNK